MSNIKYKELVSIISDRAGTPSRVTSVFKKQLPFLCTEYDKEAEQIIEDVKKECERRMTTKTFSPTKLNKICGRRYKLSSAISQERELRLGDVKVQSRYRHVAEDINLFSSRAVGCHTEMFFKYRPSDITQMTERIKELLVSVNNGTRQIAYKLRKHLEETDLAEGEIENSPSFKSKQTKRKRLINEYVSHFLIYKCFIGLVMQDLISIWLEKTFSLKWELGSRTDDANQIDGRLGDIRVSIKSSTVNAGHKFKPKQSLAEVFYTINGDNTITIDFKEVFNKIKNKSA